MPYFQILEIITKVLEPNLSLISNERLVIHKKLVKYNKLMFIA